MKTLLEIKNSVNEPPISKEKEDAIIDELTEKLYVNYSVGENRATIKIEDNKADSRAVVLRETLYLAGKLKKLGFTTEVIYNPDYYIAISVPNDK